MENILIDVDSYKVSHSAQYPKNTTSMFSYIESRSNSKYPYTLFFGLQYYLKKYLSYKVTVEDVEEAKTFFEAHGEPFNYEGWMYIAKDLKGKLPVRIRAVPEGSIVPISNILVSVESTDPKVFWIVSWLETSLLRSVWYPTTVATRSHKIKQIIMDALNKSSDDPKSEIDFKLLDFGSRGVSSQESAMIGAAAHLVNFQGSDTVVGIRCANKYYNHPMAGFSIPAMEHSSVTSFGRENEIEAYRNMLSQFGRPGALLACVSDSYNIWNACSHIWGEELREEVIKSGATVIIRLDSGDPCQVVLKALQLLEDKFGAPVNKKGYKVLNHVRILQGDGINEDSIVDILVIMLNNNYSITNIALGMGGGLLQALDRDTNKFAMKCSSVTVDGKQRDVFKDPITDSGKQSKAGRLDLVKWSDGKYQTITLPDDKVANEFSAMRTVYENGDLLIEDDLETIRNRSCGKFLA